MQQHLRTCTPETLHKFCAANLQKNIHIRNTHVHFFYELRPK